MSQADNEHHPYPNAYQYKFAKLCGEAPLSNGTADKILQFARDMHGCDVEDIPKSSLAMHQQAACVDEHIQGSVPPPPPPPPPPRGRHQSPSAVISAS